MTLNLTIQEHVFYVTIFCCVYRYLKRGTLRALQEMKKNDRLYKKVAPMGVNDIMIAVQYQHVARQPLDVPLIIFDGINDATIERGNMQGWAEYTSSWFKDVPIEGDHYFVSTKFKEVGKLNNDLKATHIEKGVVLHIRA